MKYDTSFLIYNERKYYIIVHINDIRLTGPSQENCEWVRAEITKRFDIKNVNPTRYLGLKVEQNDKTIVLSQELYVPRLLDKFNMKNCRTVQSLINKDFNVI